MSDLELRRSPMMAHLLDSLKAHQDIGHYGRLVFAMVARFFLSWDEGVAWLRRDPAMTRASARELWRQVVIHGYSPPGRACVLRWQALQGFPIFPANDPGSSNIYRDVEFPAGVYEEIDAYRLNRSA